jgi:hypothetical protein
MKRDCRLLRVLVVGGILFFQTGCQKGAGAPQEPGVPTTDIDANAHKPRTSGPRITFEKIVHNFAQVDPGGDYICEFVFANTGDSALKITNVRVSAPCCMRYSLARKEYAPGEKGTLTVNYHAPQRAGSAKHAVFVSSNDQASPKVNLTIKANILMKVACEPKELKFLLKDEEVSCPEIILTSIDGKPFAIKSFRSPDNCITASFDSSKEATKFTLQPKVDIEKLKRASDGSIRIRITHPQWDTVIIPFSVLPQFQITPPSILALNAEPQKPLTREIWVLNNYGEDFEVESTSSKEGIIKVLRQEKVGNRYRFELEITPPQLAEDKRVFTDVFYLNIKGHKTLELSCRGFYLK